MTVHAAGSVVQHLDLGAIAELERSLGQLCPKYAMHTPVKDYYKGGCHAHAALPGTTAPGVSAVTDSLPHRALLRPQAHWFASSPERCCAAERAHAGACALAIRSSHGSASSVNGRGCECPF